MENQERRKSFSVVTEGKIFVRATGFILEANLENIDIRICGLIILGREKKFTHTHTHNIMLSL